MFTQNSLFSQRITYTSILHLCHSIWLECDFRIIHLYVFTDFKKLVVFWCSSSPEWHPQSANAERRSFFDITPLPHLQNPVHHQILKLLHKYFWNPYHSILTVTTHNQSNHLLPQPFIPHTTVRIILLNQTLIHIHTHWHPYFIYPYHKGS